MTNLETNKRSLRRAFVSEASGFGPAARAGRSVLKTLSNSGSRIVARLKALTLPNRLPPLVTEFSDPSERYRVAYEVYGHNPDSEKRQHRGAVVVSYVWLFCTGMFIGYAVMLTKNYDLASAWPMVTGSFFLAAMAFAKALRSSFHSWQIRARSLGSVTRFLNSPGEWIPR